MQEPAAFMSYVRFDDKHDDGWLTRFRERLSAEVRAQTGRDFAIFQDRNDIAWGQNWQQRIDEALDTVTLLLVIITPSLFRSSACRAEVNKFLDRERALGREDLILPVYYISAREMDDPALRESDDMAKVLASRQLADLRQLRLDRITSPRVRKTIAQLASRMRDTFWQPPVAPDTRPGGHGQAAESQARSPEDREDAYRVPAEADQQTHVVNAYGQQEDTARTSRDQYRLRYALAILGGLLIVLGVWALLALSGRPRLLLSGSIVLGFVLILMSVWHFKRTVSIVGAIVTVGVFGVIAALITPSRPSHGGPSGISPSVTTRNAPVVDSSTPPSGEAGVLTAPAGQNVRSVAYSPDGKFLAVGDANGHVYVWSVGSNSPVSNLPDPGSAGVNSVAFNPGNTILAAGDANGNIYLWGGTQHNIIGTLTDPASRGVRSVAYSPDGYFLAAAD